LQGDERDEVALGEVRLRAEAVDSRLRGKDEKALQERRKGAAGKTKRGCRKDEKGPRERRRRWGRGRDDNPGFGDWMVSWRATVRPFDFAQDERLICFALRLGLHHSQA
jgi:hypothetical protein